MTSIYSLRSAMSAPVSINCYPNRTPEEYAQNVADRFGGQLPGWPHLAKLESAAMRERLKMSAGAQSTFMLHQGASHEVRYYVQREDAIKRHQAKHDQILAILADGQATKRDVASVIGCHHDTAGDFLRQMNRAGMIRRETVGGCHVYSLPQAEAAE